MNTLATEKKTIQPSSAVSFGAARNGLLQRNCACGQHTMAGATCESCGKQAQRPGEQAVPDVIPPAVEEVLGASGQPLDAASREFFEPRFGHDFSQVRVHTDAKAAESARAVDALAYTLENNIVLGPGQYSPATKTGKKLLAHELTHVVQQGAAGPPRVQREIASAETGNTSKDEGVGKIEHGSVPQGQFKRATSIGRADDLLERQADLVAERVCSTGNQNSYSARDSLAQAQTKTGKDTEGGVTRGFSFSAANSGVLQRQPPKTPDPTAKTPQPQPTNPPATTGTSTSGRLVYEYKAFRKGNDSDCAEKSPLNEVDMPVVVFAPATISSSTVDLFVFFHGWRADLGARTASGVGSKAQGTEKMTELSHLEEAVSGTGRVGIAPQAPKSCVFSESKSEWNFGQFSQWHQVFRKKGFDDFINLVLKNLSDTKGLKTTLTPGAIHVAGHSGGGQGIVESTNIKGGAKSFADKVQDVTLQDAGYGDTWETMMDWFFQGTPQKTVRVLIAPGDQARTRKVLVKIKSAIADMNKAGTFQITEETIPKPQDQKPMPGGFIIESKWVAKKGSTLQGTIIVFFTPKGGHYETSFASMAAAAAAQPSATDDFLGTVKAGGLFRVLPTSGEPPTNLPVFEKSDLKKKVKDRQVTADSKVWVVDVEKVYPFNARIADENHKELGWISLIHLGPVAASAQPAPPPPAQPTTPATPPAKVQPKRASLFGVNVKSDLGPGSAVPALVDDVLHSSGQPLDASTRSFMEPRFGHDFSSVRVHTDPQAQDSAQTVDALAYTLGNDVVFGAGQFAPTTTHGRHLLAHELAHVVQQQAAGAHTVQAQPETDHAGNPLEQEADLMAEAVMGSPRREGLGSATLPYREAVELADCLRIMGEKNMDYCLEAAPREKSRRICSGSGVRNPLSDMSTFQSPGASGWWGAKFGCYRNTCSRPHRGWDIFAPVGTPILAAVTGTISRHKEPSGLGDFIKLRSLVDPTRAYLYAHLSDREPAGFYCVGNTIGKTGTSGNASSNRPHLHLQLQINGANADPGSDFSEPTNVIEATGSSATVIDKTLPEPCAQCAM